MKVISIFNSTTEIGKPNFNVIKDRFIVLYPDLKTASCDLGQGSGILQLPALLTEQKIIIVDATTDTTSNRLPNLLEACELFGYNYVTYAEVSEELRRFLGDEIYNKKYPEIVPEE